MYKEYTEPISSVAPHRVLAFNRGEKEGFLKVPCNPLAFATEALVLRLGRNGLYISSSSVNVVALLDDQLLRNLSDRLTYLRNMEEQKDKIISSIEEQQQYYRGF